MNGMVKDNFIYLITPKNGCTTYINLLERHGWKCIDSRVSWHDEFDLSKMLIWGHITDPNVRHTKGVEQYLRINPDIDIDNEQIAKLLTSVVVDVHTYSLHMLFQSIIGVYPIHWIPLDYIGAGQYKSGDDLTNLFFKINNLPIKVDITDRLHVSETFNVEVQEKISQLKLKYLANYYGLEHNFLKHDIMLYNKVLMDYNMQLEQLC